MTSLILVFPLLNFRMAVYLNSLLLWEQGTNLPRPSPGEVLSFGVSPVNYSDSNSKENLICLNGPSSKKVRFILPVTCSD